ncbi:MAG: hypothetical protein WC860_04930 [Candidatus Margulisiibacteriota bacterium]|jgi:hypothetical protein
MKKLLLSLLILGLVCVTGYKTYAAPNDPDNPARIQIENNYTKGDVFIVYVSNGNIDYNSSVYVPQTERTYCPITNQNAFILSNGDNDDIISYNMALNQVAAYKDNQKFVINSNGDITTKAIKMTTMGKKKSFTSTKTTQPENSSTPIKGNMGN